MTNDPNRSMPPMAVAFGLFAWILAATASAATFTVRSTADGADANPGNGVCETAPGNGVCTLRGAIQEANALTPASDTIFFSIPGVGPHTISPATALPAITDTVVIDGTSEPVVPAGQAGMPVARSDFG